MITSSYIFHKHFSNDLETVTYTRSVHKQPKVFRDMFSKMDFNTEPLYQSIVTQTRKGKINRPLN